MASRPQVRIRNAAELFEGLRHPQAGVRLPVLAAVAAQPEVVRAYGLHEGRDVIGELCAQLEEGRDLFTLAVVSALVRFEDERVVASCLRLVRQHPDSEVVALAAERLAQDPSPEARAALRELLFALEPSRAVPAARALASRGDLEPAERIRIDAWVGLPAPLRLDSTTLPPWLEALRGPLSARVRRSLESQGAQALAILAEAELEPELRAWLVEWAAATPGEASAALLEAELLGPRPAPALSALARHPERHPQLHPLTRPHTRSTDPGQRAAAWVLTPLEVELDWAALGDEADPQVRPVLAARLAREAPRLEALLALAADPDWRVRAAAAEGLGRLGARALEAARTLALTPAPETRAVGASVLVVLEDYEWMEEHLLR